MPRYIVVTTATVDRTYEVEAPDEKAAIEASVTATPTDEVDVQEETLSVSLVPSVAAVA